MPVLTFVANTLRAVATWLAPEVPHTGEKRSHSAVSDDSESERETGRVRVSVEGTPVSARQERRTSPAAAHAPQQSSSSSAPTGMIRPILTPVSRRIRAAAAASPREDTQTTPSSDIRARLAARATPAATHPSNIRRRNRRSRQSGTPAARQTATVPPPEAPQDPPSGPSDSYIYPGTNVVVTRSPRKTLFPIPPPSQEEIEFWRRAAAEARSPILANERRRLADAEDKPVEEETEEAIAPPDAAFAAPATPAAAAAEEPVIVNRVALPAAVTTPVQPASKTGDAVAAEIGNAVTTAFKAFTDVAEASSKSQTEAMAAVVENMNVLTARVSATEQAQAQSSAESDAHVRKVVYGVLDEFKPMFMQLLQTVATACAQNQQPAAQAQQTCMQRLSQEEGECLLGHFQQNKAMHGELAAIQWLQQDLVTLANRGYDVVEMLSAVSAHHEQIQAMAQAQLSAPLPIEAPDQDQLQIQGPIHEPQAEAMDMSQGGSATPEKMRFNEQQTQIDQQQSIAEHEVQIAEQELKAIRDRISAQQARDQERAQQLAAQAQQAATHQAREQTYPQAYQHAPLQNIAPAPVAQMHATSYPSSTTLAHGLDTIIAAPPTSKPSRFDTTPPSTVPCKFISRPGGCRKRNACPNLHPDVYDPSRDERSRRLCHFASLPGGCKKHLQKACPFKHPDTQPAANSGSTYPVQKPAATYDERLKELASLGSEETWISEELQVALTTPFNGDPNHPVTTREGLIYYAQYLQQLLTGLTTSRPPTNIETTVYATLYEIGYMLFQTITAVSTENILSAGLSVDYFKAQETTLQTWNAMVLRATGGVTPYLLPKVERILQKLGEGVAAKLNHRHQQQHGATTSTWTQRKRPTADELNASDNDEDSSSDHNALPPKNRYRRPAQAIYQAPTGGSRQHTTTTTGRGALPPASGLPDYEDEDDMPANPLYPTNAMYGGTQHHIGVEEFLTAQAVGDAHARRSLTPLQEVPDYEDDDTEYANLAGMQQAYFSAYPTAYQHGNNYTNGVANGLPSSYAYQATAYPPTAAYASEMADQGDQYLTDDGEDEEDEML